MAPIAAAILVGGKATRFGSQPKGLAAFGRETVLERQLRALAGACNPIAVVGDELAPLASAIESSGIEVARIADAAAGLGPIGGIAAALDWSDREWLFVVAGDLPLIDARVLDRLTAGITDEATMVAPIVDGHLHPLATLYRRTVLTEVSECLERGLHSPRRLFESPAQTPIRIPFEGLDAASLRGFNTPSELDDLRRHFIFPPK